MPTLPRTLNIPPKSGTADAEKTDPAATPPAAAPAKELDVPYQAGNQTVPGAARPSWRSSRLRSRTCSAWCWRPSATAQTIAWSGVSSQASFASSTTWPIERACAIVFSSVRR